MFEELTTEAIQVLETEFQLKDIRVLWSAPRERGRGDLSTTVALELAKKLKKKPIDIAEVLVTHLSKNALVEKAEAIAPGYVNLTLTPTALLKELNRTREAHPPSLHGSSGRAGTAKVASKKDRPVVFDYSQPNIAKPLGIHHILSTVIGQSLVNLYKHLGHETVSINHIGDWGTQFGKLAVAYKKWGKKPIEQHSIDELLELYVRFHTEVETDASLEDEGRVAFKKLEEGDKDLRAFWASVVKITMESMEHLYERLNVHFDFTQGESFYEDKMAPIIEEGKKKGTFKEGKEGALIIEFPEDKNLPPAIVMKADGSTIYLTRDLATARYRIDTWHPQAIYYVVDVAQQLYFKQLFETLTQLQWELPKLEHVFFGRMSFADKSMSTRKGNILKLEEVLDEAVKRADAIIKERGETIQSEDPKELADMMGIGAVVYGILSQNRKMNMVFDWDKMLSFEGNSAPYIQYTHARAKSVLRKAETDAVDLPEEIGSLTEKERILIGTLLQFSTVLQEAMESNMPHKIATYLYELSQDFNAFYNSDPILKAPEPEKTLRLALTSFTASVLKTGATLLTLRVPDRM